MSILGYPAHLADAARRTFIQNCIASDQPRMDSVVFPEGVKVESDLPYAEGLPLPAPLAPDSVSEGSALCSSERNLDIYTPDNAKEKEVFLLIHGGAFVYGCKELDKEFGMHLALRSGITVANMNYRLLPGTDLQGILQDIFAAVSFLNERGFTTFHTIGDSAGGYLCVLTAILMNNKEAREKCGITDFNCNVRCESTHPICGDFRESPRKFAGIYFDPQKKMPAFIYNLFEAVKEFGCPSVVVTTGDQDMMFKQNYWFVDRLTTMDHPFRYYCATSTEDRPMHHVFSIVHPTWPESIASMDLTCTVIKELEKQRDLD
ncbi:MAG: alpha/beta hydrolase [Clostridiales bacterium]|nr:alpha/beta hydrolase [Clostridiales bacterium]